MLRVSLLFLAAALASGGCRCAAPIVGAPLSAAELAAVRAGLVHVSERSGRPQVHRLLADGGSAALTQGPRSHFPLRFWRGGWVVAASLGEGDAHVEQPLWLAPDGGVVELLPESRRARSAVALPDDGPLVLESGLEGFSELVEVDGEKAKARTSNPEGNFEPQPLPGGALVFVSSRDGNPELYRLPPDGPAVRLTFDDAEDVSPRVSPDGQTLAFLSSRRGQDEVFLMSALGGDARPLLKAPLPPGPAQESAREALQQDVSFDADGRQLWLSGRSGKGRLRIWRVELASGAATAFTDGAFDDDQPALSPDGRFVAWVSTRDGNPEVYAARVDGSGVTRLTRDGAPDWLPVWSQGR